LQFLALLLLDIGGLVFRTPIAVLSARPADLLWLPSNVTIDPADANYALFVNDGRSVFKDGSGASWRGLVTLSG